MTKVPAMEYWHRAISELLGSDATRSVTVYANPTMRVTATRLHRVDRRNTRESIILTYGSLNYAGREFVEACKRAGEPFPVKRPQLRFWPKKKRA